MLKIDWKAASAQTISWLKANALPLAVGFALGAGVF